MNKIKIKRMLLAGLTMFVVWIAVAILMEGVIASALFGQTTEEMWLQTIDLSHWTALNYWIGGLLPIVNCTLLIWLYASLRPMYGVGVKTALITSAFGIVLGFSLTVNWINLGLFPPRTGLLEMIFEAIEFPVAMFVGAGVYEGKEKEANEGV
jgi:hypothetical protein